MTGPTHDDQFDNMVLTEPTNDRTNLAIWPISYWTNWWLDLRVSGYTWLYDRLIIGPTDDVTYLAKWSFIDRATYDWIYLAKWCIKGQDQVMRVLAWQHGDWSSSDKTSYWHNSLSSMVHQWRDQLITRLNDIRKKVYIFDHFVHSHHLYISTVHIVKLC